MKKSIGIDVSKKTLDIAFRKEDGQFINRKIENSAKAVKDFCKKNKFIQSEHKFIMEATGSYFYQAAASLSEDGYTVFVVNPLAVKRFNESELIRVKTDESDARMLVKYAELKKDLKPFIVKEKYKMQIEIFCKSLMKIKDDIRANFNRIEAYSQFGEQMFPLVEIFKQIIEDLKCKIKEIEVEIEKLIDQNFKEEYKLALSIPGIGKENARLLIGVFGDFSAFPNAKSVVSYAGLNPSPYQSGTSVFGRGSISKKGSNIVRRMLYMGAISASKHNPKCRELSQRLKDKGKSTRHIYVAVSQKLLRQVFAVVKNKKLFEKNYEK